MESKIYLQCLVSLIITLLLPLTNADRFSKVDNIFQQKVTVKSGDIMQCEITKTNTVENNYSYYVYTQDASSSNAYQLHPVVGKCFSFKVRGTTNPHIALSSNTAVNDKDKIEVILEEKDGKYSAIRETKGGGSNLVSKLDKSGIINDREYTGFWIRWTDDELLEVGRESETIPFLSHRFSSKLDIKYVGVMTWWVSAAWIIDLEPKCPGVIQNTKMRAESYCYIIKKNCVEQSRMFN